MTDEDMRDTQLASGKKLVHLGRTHGVYFVFTNSRKLNRYLVFFLLPFVPVCSRTGPLTKRSSSSRRPMSRGPTLTRWWRTAKSSISHWASHTRLLPLSRALSTLQPVRNMIWKPGFHIRARIRSWCQPAIVPIIVSNLSFWCCGLAAD